MRVGLVGATGRWPHNGAFRGHSGGVGWAGRVAGGEPLAVAAAVARFLDDWLALEWPADRRRALVSVWDRLGAVVPADLGPEAGRDLSVVFVAEDDDGVSVSGVGLGGVVVLDGAVARPIVAEGHPLLGPPGLPPRRPGALTLPGRPDAVIASVWGEPLGAGDLLHRAGFWP